MSTREEQVQPARGKVQVGDSAPDFTLPDQSGKPVSLGGFLGKTDIVLYFYPRDDTAVCTAEACAFRDSYELFKQTGAEVIGISSDSVESHRQFAAAHQLPFILLSDADSIIRKRYGVPTAFGLPGRVTYIIDRQGRVRRIFFSQFTAEKHVTEALSTLQSLREEEIQCMNALSQLGFIDKGANLASIERAMTLMIERYYGMTLGKVRELEIPEMVQDVAYLLYGQPFHIPAQFAFTGRAVGTLVGVQTGLSPEFNFVEVATPYARKFLGLDAEGAQQTLQQLFSQLLDAGRVWLSLPHSLEQLIRRLEAGQIEVKLASHGPSGWNGFRGRRSGRDNSESSGSHPFTWIFMFVASLAGGIFLLADAHQLIAAWFCFGLAGLCALEMLVKS